MNKLNQLSKFIIYILIIGTLAVSCERDNILKNDESLLPQVKLPVNSQKIDFLNSQHYSTVAKRINAINRRLNTDRIHSKHVTDDITIVLEDIIYTEYGSTHTYTFKIIREHPLVYIENLVLHYNVDSQSYDEYLVQYNISADEYVTLSNNGQLQSSENVTITTLEQGFFNSNTEAKSCERVCETIFVACSSGAHNAGNIDQWLNCTEDQRGGTLPRAYQSCQPSCSPVETIDEGDAGNGNGGSGGGTGNNNIITNPNANESCDAGNGTIGIEGNNSVCIPTVDDMARNQLFDRLVGYMTNQDQADWIVLEADIEIVNALNDFLDSSTIYNQNENLNASILLIDFHMQLDWKQALRDALAEGITDTAELMHRVYKELSEIVEEYPSTINYINAIVDELREIADELFDTDEQTLTWEDLFGIWLFELGSEDIGIGNDLFPPQGNDIFDTIYFDGNDTTTELLKQQEGVTFARQDAIDKIANNNISDPVNRGWTYGQNEFYDSISNGNLVTAFLGSYNTKVDISLNDNGSYTLTFSVSNPSTWDSATRFRIDNDNDGNHDGIFENTYRENQHLTFGITHEINLGGNVNQIWTWTEIVN